MLTVADVFHRTVSRLQGPALCTIIEAVQAVQEMIVGRLLLRRSEILIAERDVKISMEAGLPRRVLPAGFLALSARPYLADGYRLAPLAGREQVRQAEGHPRCYRVVGRQLEVWPIPVEAIDIYVPHYARPQTIESMDDELPFHGLFDSVFIDGCVAVMSMGLVPQGNNQVAAMVQQGVDALLVSKELSAEQLLADSINDL